MTSSQGNLGEVRIPVPDLEDSNFFMEQSARLNSALDEAIKQDRDLPRTSKPLIQRVPPDLYSVKGDFIKYFEPKQVALGPLHHGNPKFERAEQIKLKLAALFVHKNETTDKALFHNIKVEICDLKKLYNPEDIEGYDDEKLAWMFFVDGCALLYMVYYGVPGEFRRLNIKADLLVFAPLDLFLLENQLPYRVLKILIASTKEPHKWKQSIREFIYYNISTKIQGGRSRQDTEDERQDYAHLLDRLRTELLTGIVERSSNSIIGIMLLSWRDNRRYRKTFRSIKELKQSGIHVRPSKSKNLRNISFYCNFLGRLEMPCLLVDDSTASKFMNLVALEKCPDFENNFAVTTYLCFLGSLIETAEDVKELRATGMLHNYYGTDEEVTDLIRRMSRDLVPDEWMYLGVTENIHRYCNSWVAWIYSRYFSSWSFIAFSGAIAGLVLTLIQTYFTVNSKK